MKTKMTNFKKMILLISLVLGFSGCLTTNNNMGDDSMKAPMESKDKGTMKETMTPKLNSMDKDHMDKTMNKPMKTMEDKDMNTNSAGGMK